MSVGQTTTNTRSPPLALTNRSIRGLYAVIVAPIHYYVNTGRVIRDQNQILSAVETVWCSPNIWRLLISELSRRLTGAVGAAYNRHMPTVEQFITLRQADWQH